MKYPTYLHTNREALLERFDNIVDLMPNEFVRVQHALQKEFEDDAYIWVSRKEVRGTGMYQPAEKAAERIAIVLDKYNLYGVHRDKYDGDPAHPANGGYNDIASGGTSYVINTPDGFIKEVTGRPHEDFDLEFTYDTDEAKSFVSESTAHNWAYAYQLEFYDIMSDSDGHSDPPDSEVWPEEEGDICVNCQQPIKHSDPHLRCDECREGNEVREHGTSYDSRHEEFPIDYELSDNQKQFVSDAREQDLEIRWNYSGRGMYGMKCPGVVVSGAGDFNTDADYQQDQMGLDIILYASH